MQEAFAVVLCTHNRSAGAIACIEQVLVQASRQPLPVVVVDSGSDEPHARALTAFAARHNTVRLVRVDLPGLARARNAGLAAVTTPWVAFLDDDVHPADDWVTEASRVVACAAEDVAMIGGRVLPRWPVERPEHVGARWLSLLSCIEAIEQDSANSLPDCNGSNLIVRRSMVQAVGGFAEDMGRVGNVLLSGEDSVLQYSLLAAQFRVLYDGQLVVEHLIGPERLTRTWVARRAFWGGVTEVFTAQKVRYDQRHLRPTKAIAATVLLRLASLAGDRQAELLIRSEYARGVLAAWWWSRRRPSDRNPLAVESAPSRSCRH